MDLLGQQYRVRCSRGGILNIHYQRIPGRHHQLEVLIGAMSECQCLFFHLAQVPIPQHRLVGLLRL
jgi:hypothetical protein